MKKIEKKESKIKSLAVWLRSKLSCTRRSQENEEEDFSVDGSAQKEVETSLQKVEDALVEFAKKTETSSYEDIKEEVEDMIDRIEDIKENLLGGDTVKETPLWDEVNEEGDTGLHLSTSLNLPEATRMLLDVGANPNIQNSQGETALHNACSQGAIDEVTSLIEKGAGLVLNKKNEPPALENLFSENQEAEKINKLMVSLGSTSFIFALRMRPFTKWTVISPTFSLLKSSSMAGVKLASLSLIWCPPARRRWEAEAWHFASTAR